VAGALASSACATSRSRAPRLYAGASLFLFASLNEGFGSSPLEASRAARRRRGRQLVDAEVLGDGARLSSRARRGRDLQGARAVLSDSKARRRREAAADRARR
jgi:hypothetical protein